MKTIFGCFEWFDMTSSRRRVMAHREPVERISQDGFHLHLTAGSAGLVSMIHRGGASAEEDRDQSGKFITMR